VLEKVDRINLKFIDIYHERSNRFSDRPIRPKVKTELFQCLNKGSNPLWVNYRGYSLIGKILILHIVVLSSNLNFSKMWLKKLNWLSGTLKMFRL
jgi:hypothetical protein